MDNFGTVKVPETYVFAKNAKALKKFVGPQSWGNKYFEDILLSLANPSK